MVSPVFWAGVGTETGSGAITSGVFSFETARGVSALVPSFVVDPTAGFTPKENAGVTFCTGVSDITAPGRGELQDAHLTSDSLFCDIQSLQDHSVPFLPQIPDGFGVSPPAIAVVKVMSLDGRSPIATAGLGLSAIVVGAVVVGAVVVGAAEAGADVPGRAV
jgi:hypothetical protein